MIIREKNKSLELSPESVKELEISKIMIKIKDDLLLCLEQNLIELVNTCPLCVVPDNAVALYLPLITKDL